ncbi:MAG: FtsQ-type POTRA domain-containing protein, partial [Christensenellaceae bacterium]|nr:FtsQ-type POTRA domain-containing protein [Christensenellaceae bacterium]
MDKSKRTLLIISALLLIVALAFAGYMVFRVREVVVLGCAAYCPDDIVEMAGVEYGESIFLLDKQAVTDALLKEPRIRPVEVRTELPDRVVIAIEERQPAAYIEKNGALVVIDKTGWVLDVISNPTGMERPLLIGLQADAFEVGQELRSGDLFRVDVMTRVLQAAQEAGISLDCVYVTLAADITLETADGLVVKLGDDTRLDEKMRLVNALKEKLAAMGKTGGIL